MPLIHLNKSKGIDFLLLDWLYPFQFPLSKCQEKVSFFFLIRPKYFNFQNFLLSLSISKLFPFSFIFFFFLTRLHFHLSLSPAAPTTRLLRLLTSLVLCHERHSGLGLPWLLRIADCAAIASFCRQVCLWSHCKL